MSKLSYRFFHTITIFASILHSLHGLPTDVSIPHNKYDQIPLTDEEFGWKLGVIVVLVMLGGIFAGTLLYTMISFFNLIIKYLFKHELNFFFFFDLQRSYNWTYGLR